MKTSASLLFVALLGILPAWGATDWDKAEEVYKEVSRIAKRYPAEEFQQAVRDGDIKEVKRLLDSGVPVSLRIPVENHNGVPPWSQAIHSATDDPTMVRLLLARGVDPNARSSNNATPLHYADQEVAKILLDHGADVAACDDEGQQPIHLASRDSNSAVPLCQLLIKHGANPKARNGDGFQPIHYAASAGNLEAVSFFLNRGASAIATTNIKTDNGDRGWQPIHHVSSNSSDPLPSDAEIVLLLLSKGADANTLTAQGESPLHLLKGAAVTRMLLDHGAAVNIRDTSRFRDTPLHRFATRGDLESVKLLVEHGADIHALNGRGETPLNNAVFWNRKDVVAYLLKKGARPTRRTLAQAGRSGETESLGIIRARLSPSYLRPAHRR